MPSKSVTTCAIIGSTLMALSLVGSSGNPAKLSTNPNAVLMADVARLHASGKVAFSEGRYLDAREAFSSAAIIAARADSRRDAAMNWSNAGFSSLSAMQYGSAQQELSRARSIAEASGEMVPLIFALNNLASLYLQMCERDNALRTARAALAGPAGHADAGMRAKLFYQEAQALADLDRLPEAEPVYSQAIAQMMDAGDLDAAARAWANLGSHYIDTSQYQDAERALSESLRLVRTHRLKAATFVLTQLAKLRGKQGETATAELLFQEAIDAHESATPRWTVYYQRGEFRFEAGRLRAALDDFRESKRLALRMRADIVPADQDRIAIGGNVELTFAGLMAAGNRLAIEISDKALLAETFDAAEQDRLWSLRALVPDLNDWRSRLPARYWELLVKFQSTERSLLAQVQPVSEETTKEAADLEGDLEAAEAAAGDQADAASTDREAAKRGLGLRLPLENVRENLGADAVLFSFSITAESSWLWVVDRHEIYVRALPGREQIRQEVSNFTRAIQENADSTKAGRKLYATLFGCVPAAVLAHKRWLLEPDGPLYDLPFAALPIDDRQGKPTFLIEHAALQSIPGALLMEKGAMNAKGAFLGIGDPIFNKADSRYRGNTDEWASSGAFTLPRLPNTDAELEACSRAWGSGSSRLLTGLGANIGGVEQALSESPAIIHFATHVVTAKGEFGSGIIALGLDSHGAIGLMGPKDIAARQVPGSLVVMNGCHSAQGEAVEDSGLMGLTRAWIGAGARAVVATRWDVPDEAAQTLMVNFYHALSEDPRGDPATALRQAQLAALHSGGADRQPLRWAGYFLLSRI